MRETENERECDRWTIVSPRIRRRNIRDQDKTDKDKTTTCYVNNLPEDNNKKEVERVFEKWEK